MDYFYYFNKIIFFLEVIIYLCSQVQKILINNKNNLSTGKMLITCGLSNPVNFPFTTSN